jgi:NAD(P)-dependent dehydrogenase (short-subunit alcohol dehydrogenase family)
MKLTDKAIVVTGGAQGLGRACAERFIAKGVIRQMQPNVE